MEQNFGCQEKSEAAVEAHRQRDGAVLQTNLQRVKIPAFKVRRKRVEARLVIQIPRPLTSHSYQVGKVTFSYEETLSV